MYIGLGDEESRLFPERVIRGTKNLNIYQINVFI